MKPSKRKRIVFGIDEGLPARVAASILRNQDFDLLVVHLRCDLAALGEDPETYPAAMRPSDLPAIEKFCESLGVPLKVIDVTEEVLAKVYSPFWIATLSGARFDGAGAFARDILFPHLQAIADARQADAIATGHFAKVTPEIYRYPEESLDQSRILARLAPTQLSRTIFPVGDVALEMLLRLASEIGAAPKEEGPFVFAKAERALVGSREKRGRWEWTDAQLADPRVQARAAGDYFKPGAIGGAVEFAVGEHRGIPFFQVGSPDPQHAGHYVAEVQPQARQLLVATEGDLAVDTLFVHRLVWHERASGGRHRSRRLLVEKESPNSRTARLGPARVPATLFEYPDRFGELRLDSPLYAVAPGETLVFFEESRVLGSAIVVASERRGKGEMPIENPAPPA
ncbi:MAG: MnmA/TRMU family protein [Bdellovibrionales bacterium]|nr:MnmA/TRMU family protein [Bdellovibrionales bacterium]